MPRHPRLFIPEATYHVYCRVTRGEFVFDDPFEAAEFVSAVREVRDLHGWRIFAWTLMANHYHLVIKTGAIPLWRSMLRLQSEVARAFNKRHRNTRRRLHAGSVSDSASSSRIDPSASVSTTSIVKSHGPHATIQECYEC